MPIDLIFTIVFAVIVLALLIWIVAIYRRAKRATDASDARLNARLYAAVSSLPETTGHAQTTSGAPQPDPVADALDGAPSIDATPSGRKDERLAELDDLHGRGLITDDELAAARARILAE